MGLKTNSVAKCLDKRLLFFGFEVFDVLSIFLTLSILNFIFGNTSLKFFLVWLPTLVLALILHFGKKGKPDQFLLHWLRYQIKPGVYRAFPESSRWVAPPTLRGRK